MASWIKVQVTLPESPKIFRLARLLGGCRMEALGYAVRWFCWLDTYCANGATELYESEVDALVGRCGITRAFCELGWASVDAEGYVLVLDFDKHNGKNSKQRAENQARVAAFRERQEEKGSCNAESVTRALPEGEGEYICSKEGSAGIAELNSAAPAEPAPTPDVKDEGFRLWLAALCQAHPSASRSLYLAPDVLKAAKAAFLRCPAAVQSAELLTAYFKDSRLAEGKFYAPRGQRKFFDDLEDVLSHAERWRKWAGWKPKKKADASEKRQAVKTAGCEVRRCAGVISDTEREEFFKEMKGEGGDE
ncbi:MAG: hypothetical protein IKY92_09080 [Akkermansia sp.]|nr:hypothetical protein [Akkermansia sp.]